MLTADFRAERTLRAIDSIAANARGSDFELIVARGNPLDFNFARDNNRLARVARGEFLVLMNDDAELFPGTICAMLREMRNPKVGIVGAILLENGKYFYGLKFKNGHMARIEFEHLDRLSRTSMDVDAFPFALVMIRRSLWNTINGLDENYRLCFEDWDFCVEAKNLGYSIKVVPFVNLHKGRIGTGRFGLQAKFFLSAARFYRLNPQFCPAWAPVDYLRRILRR